MEPKLGLFALAGSVDELVTLAEAYRAAMATMVIAIGGDLPADAPPESPPPPSVNDMPTAPDGVPEGLWVAIMAYFPATEWLNAVRLSRAESGWRSDATNDTRGLAEGRCGEQYYLADGRPALTEYSVGAWQINLCVHNVAEDDARDYDASTRYAASLWARSGWRPWYYSALALGLL